MNVKRKEQKGHFWTRSAKHKYCVCFLLVFHSGVHACTTKVGGVFRIPCQNITMW